MESLCEEKMRLKFFAYCKISKAETGKYIYLSNLSKLDFFHFRIQSLKISALKIKLFKETEKKIEILKTPIVACQIWK